MGCINVIVRRLGDLLMPSARRIDAAPSVSASRIGGGLKVNCGLVCSVGQMGKYLNIEPEYIWLMESNRFTDDVVVWSNVEWTVS